MKNQFGLIFLLSLAFNFSFAQISSPEQEFILQFNEEQIAIVPDEGLLDLDDEFTMSIWVKIKDYSSNAIILGKPFDPRGSDPCFNYIIYIVDDKFEFVQSTGQAGTYNAIRATSTINLDEWYYLTATLKDGLMKLYVNGIFEGTIESPGTPATITNVPFGIGGGFPPSEGFCCGFSGYLKQISIWDIAMEANDISQIAASILDGNETGLLAYWQLDEGEGQIAYDLSSNQYHLQLGLEGGADEYDPIWINESILENPYFVVHEYEYQSPYLDWNLGDGVLMDINSDGYLDVLSIQVNWDTWEETPAYAFINNGSGLFTDQTNTVFNNGLAYSIATRKVLSADFNGDGKDDAYFADQGMDAEPWGGNQNTIIIQTSDGHLEKQSNQRIPELNTFSHDAAIGDIDNDGDIDIYNCNISGGEHEYPTFFVNNGNGYFTNENNRLPEYVKDFHQKYTAALFVDVNKDGFPDLILGSHGGYQDIEREEKDAVLLNDKNGFFNLADENAMPIRLGGDEVTIIEIASGDLNGDGWPDLVMVGHNYSQNFMANILLNNQDGSFSYSDNPTLTDLEVFNTSIIDLNNDGWLDILIADDSGGGGEIESKIFLNTGNAIFVDKTNELQLDNYSFEPILPGDLDNDGDIDFFAHSGYGPYYYFVENKRNYDLGIEPLLAPSPPSLISPSDNETVSQIPNLKWEESSPFSYSHIQVSTDVGFNNIVFERTKYTGLSIDLDTVSAGINYYWRVKGINTAGESDWSSVWSFNFVASNVGIQEKMLEQEIKVYPNPTTGRIHIENKDIERIEVINMEGQIIKQASVFDHQATINLSPYPKGIYFLKFIGNKNISYRRIVLK